MSVEGRSGIVKKKRTPPPSPVPEPAGGNGAQANTTARTPRTETSPLAVQRIHHDNTAYGDDPSMWKSLPPVHSFASMVKRIGLSFLAVAVLRQILLRLARSRLAPESLRTAPPERVRRAVLYFLSCCNAGGAALFGLLEECGLFRRNPFVKRIDSSSPSGSANSKSAKPEVAAASANDSSIAASTVEVAPPAGNPKPKTVRFDSSSISLQNGTGPRPAGDERSSPTGTPFTPTSPTTYDPRQSESESKRLANRTMTLFEIITGYMIHDFVCILPEWRDYPADILHHVLGLGLLTACMRNMRQLAPFIAIFLRLELSTVLLNLMWFFREFAGLKQMFPLVDKHLPNAFALVYFLVRVAYMPARVILWANTYPNRFWDGLGQKGLIGLSALMGLNVYWFMLILNKALSK
jgi:hypothetical protein